MSDNGKLTIIDTTEVPATGSIPARGTLGQNLDGRNLDTLEKARLWLTNPQHWHKTRLFILKWDGLLCTVNEEHGRRLLENPQDDGLPWCVVYEQRNRRRRGEKGEALEETSPLPEE